MENLYGYITVVIACLSYGLYIRDAAQRRTKPHIISWLIWSMLSSIVFVSQINHGAGDGAWVTGIAAVAAAGICLLTLKIGDHSIRPIDWVCLLLAAAAIVGWHITNDSLVAVVLASATFVLGLIPTMLKSMGNPHEETATTFALNGLKFFIALIALDNTNLVNTLYPAVLGISNITFAGMLIVRRHSTGKVRVSRITSTR